MAEASRELMRLESLMSFFSPESDIGRLNSNSGGEPVPMSPDTMRVLECAKHVASLSEGAFDVTSGPLTALWKRAAEAMTTPSGAQIECAGRLVSYRDLELDQESESARLAKRGQMVDLGALAKGYALDRCIAIYAQNGIKSALIDLGGNVSFLGARPNGEHWVAGIQHPGRERGKCIATLHVKNRSVITSGAYEQCFWVDGAAYHHIVDPRTGYPCESDLLSATIVAGASSSMLADALATAVFILGLTEGARLVELFPATDALLVARDQSLWITKGLLGSVMPTGLSTGLTCI